MNSDGSQISDGDVSCRLFIQASTRAEDGMDLPLYDSYFSRTSDGLPDETQLASDVHDMMALLVKLRHAPLVDPFSGPAILSGRAAGVFFHRSSATASRRSARKMQTTARRSRTK